MGSLYKGICYPTVEQARSDYCQSLNQVWGSGTSYATLTCINTDFTPSYPLTLCKRVDLGQCTYSTRPYPYFPDCNYSGSTDLAYEWFLMAFGLLVVVWGGKQLIKLFDQHHDRD